MTANKQLIAHSRHRAARSGAGRGLEIRFEASVAGGIPVLRALAGRTRRRSPRRSARHPQRHLQLHPEPHAVARPVIRRRADEAQHAGYAEADPTEDSMAPTPPRSSPSLPPSDCVGPSASPTSRPIDSTDRAGGFRIRPRARLHDPPDRARIDRRRRPRCSPPSVRRWCR